MNHPTPKHFLILFACLLLATLACNLPSPGRSSATLTPRPTRIPTNTPPPTNTPGVYFPSPDELPTEPADLYIQQILLRYDPARSLGNVEVTVCNNWAGEVGEDAQPFEVLLTVGSTQHRIRYEKAIPNGLCADVYDPQADFNTYGITAPGSITLQAEITGVPSDPPEGNTFQATLNVPFLEPPEIIPGTDKRPLRANEPHEILKNINNYYAEAPIKYENALATLTIAEMQVCLPKVTGLLGLPMPEVVTSSYDRDTNFPGVPSAHPLTGFVTTYSSLESLGEALKWADFPWDWDNVRKGYCRGGIAHELTHLLVTMSPLPHALNEGLATYVEPRVASETAAVADFECREDGWFGMRYNSTKFELVPYADLEKSPVNTPDENLNMYYTGMCFWDYIEKTYGREKVQIVAQRLHEIQNQALAQGQYSFCGTYFIRDILNPIVGEDVTPVTEPRFGVGLLMSDCE